MSSPFLQTQPVNRLIVMFIHFNATPLLSSWQGCIFQLNRCDSRFLTQARLINIVWENHILKNTLNVIHRIWNSFWIALTHFLNSFFTHTQQTHLYFFVVVVCRFRCILITPLCVFWIYHSSILICRLHFAFDFTCGKCVFGDFSVWFVCQWTENTVSFFAHKVKLTIFKKQKTHKPLQRILQQGDHIFPLMTWLFCALEAENDYLNDIKTECYQKHQCI